jgi:hypothetical protein
MRRKTKQWELSEEMRIVFESSPNLVPCKKVLPRKHRPLRRPFEGRKVRAVHRVLSADGQGAANYSTVVGVAEEQE